MKTTVKMALYSACIAFGATQTAAAGGLGAAFGEVSDGYEALISIDINYIGFCDGVHLDLDTATGKAYGHATGCAPAGCPAFGDYSFLPVSGEIVLAESVCSYAGDNGVRWQYVINIAARTFDLWFFDGVNPPTLNINDAPWEFGVAPLTADSTSSSQD